ncbi:hypothetical protein E0K89_019430 [Aquicoccus sp. SCR17]|nr:hypothetical protein [Carideicomes alvinocaridis]
MSSNVTPYADLIARRHRHLAASHYPDPERPPSLTFGVGPGWLRLVDELLTALDEADVPFAFGVTDIRDKNGRLEVFLDGWNDVLDDIVDHYCDLSETVCAICGEPGKPRGPGWRETLCVAHVRRHGKLTP